MPWNYIAALVLFFVMLAWAEYGRQRKDLGRLSFGQFVGGLAALAVAIMTPRFEDASPEGKIGLWMFSIELYLCAAFLLFVGARGLWRCHWHGETLRPRRRYP